MKNKILIHICLLAMILVTSSCTPVVDAPTSAPTSENTPTQTLTPYPTPTPTKTLVPTSTPTPTPAPLPACIELKNEEITFDEGTIILAEYNYSTLWDLKSSKRIYLGISGYVAISPDYEKFAYISGNYVIVASADGTWLHKYPAFQSWSGVIAWLNTDKLLIERSEATYRNPGALSQVIVLDLATGDFDIIHHDEFPDIVFSTYRGIGPDWLGNLAFLPNSKLSYAVYAKDSDVRSIILWDRVQQKEVVNLDRFGFGSSPEWNKDGDYFITSGSVEEENIPYYEWSEDLFLVQTDGVIKNLTNLAVKYHSIVSGYALSPDENRVAFWLNFRKSNNWGWRLAILDMETGALSNYCTNMGRGYTPHAPFWSPDGNYLLFSSYDSPNYLHTWSVSILDKENRNSMEISQTAWPDGWLHSVP